jgi:hypothetical protein
MTRTREHKTLYTILGIGAAMTFLGHGMRAVRGKDSFIGLFTGTMKNIFGVDIGTTAGETFVQVVGGVDLAITAAIVLLIVGALQERGTLYRAAYSKLAIGVFAWGAVWGFLTALSRVTAAEAFYPEVWDWIERAPNFMLPVALVYVIVRHRTVVVPDHVPAPSDYVKS